MTVADDCAELAFLADRLDAALLRDNTHIGRGRPIAPLTLYNTDVMQAKIILATEIPAAAIQAAQILNEQWRMRDIRVSLIALPRFADRMHALDLVTEHRQLTLLTAGWLRITKQALGLQTRPHPLRFRCPYCETGTLLMDVAAVAYVNPRDLTAPPKWERRGSHVYCPDCLADWPEPNWGQLMLLLEQAAREKART